MLVNLFYASLLCGTFAILFVTPAAFARGIYLIEYSELSKSEKITCWIPFINIIKAEKLYTGSVSVVGISIISLTVTTIIRVLVVFLAPKVFLVQFVTVVLFLIAIVAVLVANMRIVWMVLTDTDAINMGKRVFYTLVFPLGQYYIGSFLPAVLNNLAKEEEVFK